MVQMEVTAAERASGGNRNTVLPPFPLALELLNCHAFDPAGVLCSSLHLLFSYHSILFPLHMVVVYLHIPEGLF